MLGIISVTEKGDTIAEKIQCNLGGEILKKSSNKKFSLDMVTKYCFERYKFIIFISSTGIAVRAIAKYLKGKDIDPAVVVVDVCNNFSISLVSGHIGGANRLTNKVSNILGNTAVITTATDNLNIDAPDIIAIENRLIIEDLKKAKVIASALVNKKDVYYKDDYKEIKCPKGYRESEEIINSMVWITNKAEYYDKVLKLIRKNIVLGIGCRRNTDSEEMLRFVFKVLDENNIDKRAIKNIATIDIKNDEKAILELCKTFNIGLLTFTKDEIKNIHNKYDGSDFVEKSIGVRAVSEPVVELAGAKIIVNKIKNNGMTLCIGQLR